MAILFRLGSVRATLFLLIASVSIRSLQQLGGGSGKTCPVVVTAFSVVSPVNVRQWQQPQRYYSIVSSSTPSFLSQVADPEVAAEEEAPAAAIAATTETTLEAAAAEVAATEEETAAVGSVANEEINVEETAAAASEEGTLPEEGNVDVEKSTSDDPSIVTEAEPKEVRHTVFVGNLPFDKTDVDIRALFSQYGTIKSCSLPRNRNTGSPRGFAFIDLATEEEAAAAIASLDGHLFGSRNIRVSKSAPKEELEKRGPSSSVGVGPRRNAIIEGAQKLYVGNIPFETKLEEITNYFQQFGKVLEAYIPTDRVSGTGRGFAFVTMMKEEAEKVIQETNGFEFLGRKLLVNIPLPPGEKSPSRKSYRMKLYVGNLSFYTIVDTLVEAFSEFGVVHDCYVPEDASGASRGFGFVTMDREDAERAIVELDGCEIDGRTVRVNEANPK